MTNEQTEINADIFPLPNGDYTPGNVVAAITHFDETAEGTRPDSDERTRRAIAIAAILCSEPGWPKIAEYPFTTFRGKARFEGFARWLKSFREFANRVDDRFYYPLMAPGSWHGAEQFRRNVRLITDLIECAGWEAYAYCRPAKRRRRRK